MATVINLNKVRKQRARAEAARKAAENRAAHGRSKATKQRDSAEKAKTDSTVDGARRNPGGDDPAPA
jgi:hypothetical protein